MMLNETTLGGSLLRRGLNGLIVALMLVLAMAAGLLISASGSAAADLPYGPYTCKQGFVWREAVPADFVCVTLAIRSDTATENAMGPSRVEPGGGASGPDTCKVGYVWRETRPSDHVCVPYASRDRAKVNNENAPFNLIAPHGTPNTGNLAFTEARTGYPYSVNLYVHGTFAPNHSVQFYVYDPSRGDRGLTQLANIPTDGTGTLTSRPWGVWKLVKYTECTRVQTSGWIMAPIVTVDKGTGIVSSGGWVVTVPWC